ncbi:MAG: spore coat U domain-containing protein [Myxococcota bacterium]|nr:spore coat U domain-containing protein [Myxococcota bacterium]
MSRGWTGLLLGACVLLGGGAAQAECVVAAATLSFGLHEPLTGQPTDVNGHILLSCKGPEGYELRFGPGQRGSHARRLLQHTGQPHATLGYNLYRDPGRTQVLKETVALTGKADGQGQAHVVIYGRIYGRQLTAPAGHWRDEVPIFLPTGGKASLEVAAHTPADCTVSSGNTLAFGEFSGGEVRDAEGFFTVTCTRQTAYTVTLDQGQHARGDLRHMARGDSLLAYRLYLDPGRRVEWRGTTGRRGKGSGLPQVQTVYGRIPAGQRVAAGEYQDVVTITVTY